MATKTLRQNSYSGFVNKGSALTNDEMDNTLIGLSDDIAAKVSKSGDTMSGLLNFAPATTSRASVNMNSGISPTAPNVGDFWAASGVLYYYYGGAANSLLYTNGVFSGTIANTATINAKTTLLNIQDNTDATKVGKFSTAAIATGTTVTINFPTASGTMATLAGTEAFTNKTIDGSVIGGTTRAAGSFTTLSSNSTTALGATSATSLDSTPIGATTASTGRFTTLTTTGNWVGSGTGLRITGDFSNATVASRMMVQSSTANGSTLFEAIPNGTPTAGTDGGSFVANENSDPANGALGQISVLRGTEVKISSDKRGTGSYLPLKFYAGGAVRHTINTVGQNLFNSAVVETSVAIAASNIDLSLGNYFTKTISGATTFTLSNVPTTGNAIAFSLNLTNAGSATITWWSGIKWAGGAAPTFTASGRDRFVFVSEDGGTTWDAFLVGKAMA